MNTNENPIRFGSITRLLAKDILAMSDEAPLDLIARVSSWTDEEWSEVDIEGSNPLKGTDTRLAVLASLVELLRMS